MASQGGTTMHQEKWHLSSTARIHISPVRQHINLCVNDFRTPGTSPCLLSALVAPTWSKDGSEGLLIFRTKFKEYL